LEDAVVRYGVAQALLDGLSTTEEGLAVRDIFPDIDFRGPSDFAIATLKREWIQPVSGTYLAANEHSQQEIYNTSKNSNNDQKVLVIYGIRLLRTGPGRVTSSLTTSSIVFRRSTVKTIDIWQIEMLDTIPDQVIYGRTPLLFKKGDNMRIDFILKASATASSIQIPTVSLSTTVIQTSLPVPGISGTNDYLMFLGKIIEKIGDQVTG
jgi:hypothetical protein